MRNAKWVREDLELDVSNGRMKLEQAMEWLRINTLMMKEAHCNDELRLAQQEKNPMLDAYEQDRIRPDPLNNQRFKVPESIFHHPSLSPLHCSQERSLTDRDLHHSHLFCVQGFWVA